MAVLFEGCSGATFVTWVAKKGKEIKKATHRYHLKIDTERSSTGMRNS